MGLSVDRLPGSFRSEPPDGQSVSLPLALSGEPGPAPWLLGGGAPGSATQSLRRGSEFSFRRRQGVFLFRHSQLLAPSAACLPCLPASPPNTCAGRLVLLARSGDNNRQETVWFSLIAAFGLSSEFLRMLSPRICSVPFIVLCALQGV